MENISDVEESQTSFMETARRLVDVIDEVVDAVKGGQNFDTSWQSVHEKIKTMIPPIGSSGLWGHIGEQLNIRVPVDSENSDGCLEKIPIDDFYIQDSRFCIKLKNKIIPHVVVKNGSVDDFILELAAISKRNAGTPMYVVGPEHYNEIIALTANSNTPIPDNPEGVILQFHEGMLVNILTTTQFKYVMDTLKTGDFEKLLCMPVEPGVIPYEQQVMIAYDGEGHTITEYHPNGERVIRNATPEEIERY